ncbi:MAG: hypothetical protein WBL80_01020 [Erysipelotrichaceae bacterium]
MKIQRQSSGFTLIGFLIGVCIAVFLLMTAYVVFGFLGIFNLAHETVCQSNRGILKNVYDMYSIVEKKPVADHTTGVAFLVDGGYMTQDQAKSESLSKMVWRVYDSGAVDVFCTLVDANLSTEVYRSTFFAKDNIQSLKGSWKTGNGVLSPVAAGENRAIFGGTSGTDYTIEINVAYLGGNPKRSGYGIYYRVSDGKDLSGYVFQFDPGKGNIFAVRTVVKGRESKIIHFTSMVETMGSGFDITAPHDIKIVVAGQSHVISVDGVQVLIFTDATFSSGSVGVRTWNDSIIRFNKVIVTKQ